MGSTGGRGHKGQIYEGGLRVPAFIEWPAKIPHPRTTNFRANTCDIYPTLLEIAGVKPLDQPPLDGISLVPVIEGSVERRPKPMGFWAYRIGGIRTPSAAWMAELLAAQRAGGDLEPYEASRRAAKLPDPPYPLDKFPGHAAWIDGDWKLHRIEKPDGQIAWELYNLAADPAEQHDLSPTDPARAADAVAFRPGCTRSCEA